MNESIKIDVTVSKDGELFDFVLLLAGVPRRNDRLGIHWNNKKDEDPQYYRVEEVTWLDDIVHVFARDA